MKSNLFFNAGTKKHFYIYTRNGECSAIGPAINITNNDSFPFCRTATIFFTISKLIRQLADEIRNQIIIFAL